MTSVALPAGAALATGGDTGAAWVLAGVAVVCLLEDSVGLGAILPAETVVLSAAAAAAHGVVPLWAVFLVAWLCGALGDTIGYGIGRRWGPTLVERYGAKVGLSAERMQRADQFVARWGALGVAAGRLIPAVRLLVMPSAGAGGLGLRRFVVADVIGVAAWAGLHVTLGYLVGLGIDGQDHGWVLLGALVLAGGGAIAAGLLRWRHHASRRLT